MLGHCYPIFAQFKGGKAVSSFFGMVLAIDLRVTAAIFVLWNILKFFTNYVSVASMITGLGATVMFYYFYGSSTSTFILLLSALFVIYRHRSNIARLIEGTENKVRNR
jgi:glycerol-3-phosphate acyltransferase PlsY